MTREGTLKKDFHYYKEEGSELGELVINLNAFNAYDKEQEDLEAWLIERNIDVPKNFGLIGTWANISLSMDEYQALEFKLRWL